MGEYQAVGFWTPEKESYIEDHPLDFDGFNAKYGPVERHVWRSKRNRYVGPQRTVEAPLSQPQAPTITVTQPATEREWWDYLKGAESSSQRSLSLSTSQQQTTFKVPGNLPIGIVFTGDWHLGARGVDYEALDHHLNIVRNTAGLYAVGMGDFVEGVSVYDKARNSLYTGAYNNPEEQDVSLRLRAGIARDKWLVMLSGNHDEMHSRHTGSARISRIAQELGCPHFGEGGGTIYVHIGDQRYAIGVRHHFGGKSANTGRKMVDDWPEWERLHVAVMAHLHFNELQRVSKNNGRFFALRCGTFKLKDDYADSKGFKPEMGTPMIILLPDQEKVYGIAGDDFEEGVDLLDRFRETYLRDSGVRTSIDVTK